MPPKKLDVLVSELREEHDKLEQKVTSETNAVRGEVTKKVGEEGQRIEKLMADASARSEAAAKDAEDRINSAIAETRTALEKQIAAMDMKLKKTEQNMIDLSAETKKGIQDAIEALAKRIEGEAQQRHEETVKACNAHAEMLVNNAFNTAKEESDEQKRKLMTLMENNALRAHAESEEVFSRGDANLQQTATKIQGIIDTEMSNAAQARRELEARITASLAESSDNTKKELAALRQQMEMDAMRNIGTVAKDVGQQVANIRQMVRGAENTHTRAIIWRITGFRGKLQQLLSSEGRSIWSPDFSICAAPLMALQLQISQGNEQQGQIISPMAQKALPMPGMVSIRLWGQAGTKVTFRIGLGDGGHISKRFEHTFEGIPPQNADSRRAQFYMTNLCMLDRVWERQADVLSVHFELLDMKFIVPQELAVAPPEASIPDARGDKEQPSNLGDIEQLTLVRQVAADALLFDRLTRELAVVKNRSVRRIEWRLDGCSQLLALCRVGEAVDSAHFGAAGLDKVQLHFYPRGVDANSAGNCSLFISCPPRTFLRCTLGVGKQTRHIEHKFERQGEVYGKARFCPLDAQVDHSDGVMISVDVTEVHTDLVDQGVLRPASAKPGQPGGGAVTSVLKLRRADPQNAEEVVRCASLPAIGGLGGTAPRSAKLQPAIGNSPSGKQLLAKSLG